MDSGYLVSIYYSLIPIPYSVASDFLRRHRSEQYFTSSQQTAHFLRQVNDSWQTAQTLVGKLDLD